MPRYCIDDVEYVSCTEILGQLDKSDALIPWSINCAIKYIQTNLNNEKFASLDDLLIASKTNFREVSKDSLDIGSEVHSTIECYIKTGRKIKSENEQVESAMKAFYDWEDQHKVKWLESEKAVVHVSVGIAGTLDAIAEIDGQIVCIDFKSSKAIYPEYITQVCAYKFARESMSGEYSIDGPNGKYCVIYDPIHIDCVGILRLDKSDGQPEWKLINNQEKINREWRAFQALVDYYYLSKKRRLKHNVRAI